MAAIDRFILLVRDLRRGERGMALPTTLFVMVTGIALAGTAVMSTVNVQQETHRDSATKSAIAVADAGANIARSRIDRYATVLATKPCLKKNSTSGMLEGTVALSDGWCPAVEGTVGGGRYSYRVSPAGSTCGEYKLCVVSTGTVSEASRRIEVAYEESAIQETIEEKTTGETTTGEEKTSTGSEGSSVIVEGLIGLNDIKLKGNPDVRVGVGTNGNVIAEGNATVCNDVRHGTGKKFEKTGNAKQCTGYHETEGNKTLPPVTSFMPSNIATSNSNYRLVKCTKTKPVAEPTGCELDTYGPGSRTSTTPWNPTTRKIDLGGNSTLTVTGGDYWICQLEMTGNTQLIIGANAKVRFFFDTPEHCGLSSGATQIQLTGNTRISATGYQASVSGSMPGFYLLGSATVPTTVNITGNQGTIDEFVIYGPNTNFNLSGNATYKGIIAGKEITLEGNPRVENDAGYRPPVEIAPVTEVTKPAEGEKTTGETKKTTVTTARYYTPQFYVECTGTAAAGAAPNASC